MDLKAFVAGERPHVEGRGFAGIVQRPPRKPMIAAVEGWALAGGFEVALACDVIVAARDARFGIPEVKRGLVAAGGALLRLPRRIPYHLAMELALTGDPIGAERAYEIGIVSRLTEPGEALAGARDLAATIARNGPLAVEASKHIVTAAADWPPAEAWDRQAAIAGCGAHLRGRPRGRAGVRREARPGVARAVAAPRTSTPAGGEGAFLPDRAGRARRVVSYAPPGSTTHHTSFGAGAGVQLSPNATRVLYRLGVGDPLEGLACEPLGKQVRLWNTGQSWRLFDLGAQSRAALRVSLFHAASGRPSCGARRWRAGHVRRRDQARREGGVDPAGSGHGRRAHEFGHDVRGGSADRSGRRPLARCGARSSDPTSRSSRA